MLSLNTFSNQKKIAMIAFTLVGEMEVSFQNIGSSQKFSDTKCKETEQLTGYSLARLGL